MKLNVLIIKTYNHNHHYYNQMITLAICSLSNCKTKALLLDSSLETLWWDRSVYKHASYDPLHPIINGFHSVPTTTV